jgi:hypothetical protein
MTARSLIANVLVPLGLAGGLHAVGIWPLCVLALFIPYWAVLILREADWRLREHLPRGDTWLLATWGYPAALLGVLLHFGWLQAGLPKPAFSFLAGVAFIELWLLLMFLLAGASWVMKGAFRRYQPPEWFILLLFLSPLAVSLGMYAALVPSARILTLPLAAGAVLALLVTGATLALLGEQTDRPPGRPRPPAQPD